MDYFHLSNQMLLYYSNYIWHKKINKNILNKEQTLLILKNSKKLVFIICLIKLKQCHKKYNNSNGFMKILIQ